MAVDDDTRKAWATASTKYEREYDEHLEQARSVELLPVEVDALRSIVPGARVVHPMSGHGLDDIALARLGARSVLGLDYSEPAVASAQRRADALGLPCRYIRTTLPATGLDAASADLVYTGKGALIWMPDLGAFLDEMHRVLRPGGHFFVYEGHPLIPMWSSDTDDVRIRYDRSYFAPTNVNDTFPANGAVEHQRTLAQIVMAALGAGFVIERFAEHPEPFWEPQGVPAAAFDGRLPNSFSLLARAV
jgi:SAM-dependent methyltransferase